MSIDKKQIKLTDLTDQNFWHALNPDAHITDTPFVNQTEVKFNDEQQQSLVQHMAVDGYFHTSSVLDVNELIKLRNIVLNLYANGLLPLFATMYDEFWQLVIKLRKCYAPILGDAYRLTPDFWVFYIRQDINAHGWQIHRDAPFTKEAINENGLPNLLTVWLPLTDVTPYDSCMYVVPRVYDEIYHKIRRGELAHSNDAAFPVQLNHIRALPVKAGEMLGWDATLLHWGSASSFWATLPRISIGIYYESASQNKYAAAKNYDSSRKYIEHDNLNSVISFENRLRIVANNLNTYKHKFDEGGGAIEDNYAEVFQQFRDQWCWKS